MDSKFKIYPSILQLEFHLFLDQCNIIDQPFSIYLLIGIKATHLLELILRITIKPFKTLQKMKCK